MNENQQSSIAEQTSAQGDIQPLISNNVTSNEYPEEPPHRDLLKRRWILGVLLSALTITTTLVAGMWLVIAILVHTYVGFVGLGNDATTDILVGYIIVGILAFVMGLICFNRYVSNERSFTVFIVLPSIVFLSVALRMIPDDLTFRLGTSPSPIIYGLVQYITLAVAFVGIAVILLNLHLLIFKFLKRVHRLVGLVVCIALSFAYCFLVPHLLSTYENKHHQQANKEAQAQELHGTQSLPFVLYKPAYVPQGYRVYASLLGDIPGNPPYYKIAYSPGNNGLDTPGSYSINQFAVPATFKPPGDCGHEAPLSDDLSEPGSSCTLIGQTKSGYKVYYASPSSTHQISTAYCQFNKTLVTYSAALSTDNSTGLTAGLDKAEILKIFDSLTPSTAAELQRLKPN